MQICRFIGADATFYRDENGRLHREDGPAAIARNSIATAHYKHGVVHNLFGPAWIDRYGKKHWIINGYFCTLQLWKWADECGIDLNNLHDEDKCALYFEWKNYDPQNR